MANTMGTMFTDGEVSPARLEYNSVDLGLTIEDMELEKVINKKEIMVAQWGTAPYDIVDVGTYWRVRATVTYTTLTVQALFNKGITVSGAGTAAKHGDVNYKSYYDNYAATLIMKLVDSESAGVANADPKYWFTWLKAVPVHASEIQTTGPETQRGIAIEFHCFKDRVNLAYGYNGAASSVGL